MKTCRFALTAVLALLLSPPIAAAAPPDITIDLDFDKASYAIGEPVRVTVTVANAGGSEILINRGFRETVFHLKLRILDPAGRLVGLVQNPEAGGGHPLGPVPVTFRDGQFIRVYAWDPLPAGWSTTSETDNLQEFYLLNLPGPYSAKVQVSAIEFKTEDPGNLGNYAWQGVLESNTVYFNFAGSTAVEAAPDQWSLTWSDKKEIKLTIRPDADKTVDDYEAASIRLNNREPLDVRVLPSKIDAFFNAQAAIGTLGVVQAGQFYPAVISGRLTDGTFFGGSSQIQIVP
jgi:hypothetical protein